MKVSSASVPAQIERKPPLVDVIFKRFQAHQRGSPKFSIGKSHPAQTCCEVLYGFDERSSRQMRRCHFGEQGEIDLVGTLIGRSFLVDADLCAGQLCGYDLSEFSHLIVSGLTASIHDKKAAAVLGGAADGPFDGTGHVSYINQGSPGRSVAEHRDLSRCQGAGDKIIEHQVETQPIGHAACSYEPQACHSHSSRII